MSSLDTLTQFERGIDLRAWTATEILNPGVALIDRRKYLGILLAKNVSVERDGTVMSAVRWVRIPLGWRMWAMQAISRFRTVRLPDEWLFNEVFMTLAANGMFVARLDREARYGVVLPTPAEWPYPLRPLTSGQYCLLANASGRLLRAQIVAMFEKELGADGESARGEPAWPNGPQPWTMFGE